MCKGRNPKLSSRVLVLPVGASDDVATLFVIVEHVKRDFSQDVINFHLGGQLSFSQHERSSVVRID